MNRRLTGNASKNAVIAFGFFWTNGCASEDYWKKSKLDILKTIMELLLKFKPVSSLKCQTEYLFISIVCK